MEDPSEKSPAAQRHHLPEDASANHHPPSSVLSPPLSTSPGSSAAPNTGPLARSTPEKCHNRLSDAATPGATSGGYGEHLKYFQTFFYFELKM
jgi:hypothetical protein